MKGLPFVSILVISNGFNVTVTLSLKPFFFSQFLRDVLDTLFCLLDDNTDKYGPLVFQSLVGKLKECSYIVLYGLFCLEAEEISITSIYVCVCV